MTGLWQVEAGFDEHFDDRAELDLRYIDQWSLWMDLGILLRTVPAVLIAARSMSRLAQFPVVSRKLEQLAELNLGKHCELAADRCVHHLPTGFGERLVRQAIARL